MQWDVVASLGALIMARYPEYVRNIVTVLTKEMEQCEIWEANNYKVRLVCGASNARTLTWDYLGHPSFWLAVRGCRPVCKL